MKRVTNACVGGRNFTLNDDAYNRLDAYLRNFKAKLTVPESQKAEVMDDIESRISDLFFQEVGETSRVVSLEMVEKVVSTLGMPDGSPETGYAYSQAFAEDKAPGSCTGTWTTRAWPASAPAWPGTSTST